MSMRNIVFDFDGVVCDSTDECMVTSWNAWEKWQSRDGFRRTLDEFSNEEKIAFRKMRPRVRGAGEYYILRRALDENISINTQEVYNKFEEKWKDSLDDFKVVFFEARNRLRNENLDQWIDLHPIFTDVVDVMKLLNQQNRLYMATLKDAESVRLILSKQGLSIPEERLLDQSQIRTKLQALDYFREQLGCVKSDMIFIDDNVFHLLQPFEAGYSVYLTVWGCVMDEYLQIAKKKNIPLLEGGRENLKNIFDMSKNSSSTHEKGL